MLGWAKSWLVAVVIGVGLAATLATGVTYAASSGSAVKACVSRHGLLALATKNDHCPAGYRKTTLGAQGPRGKTGDRGAKGAKGDHGPAGVINARYYASTESSSTLPSSDAVTVVGSIANLAAGHWFISASLTASSPGASGTSLHLVCHLHLSLASPADDKSVPAQGTLIQDIFGTTVASLSTQNAFYATSVSTVDLDCDSAGSPNLANIRITAVPVSTYRL